MSKIRLFEWAKRLKERRESVENDSREEAPVTTRTDTNVHHKYIPGVQTVTDKFNVSVLRQLQARVYRVRLELAGNG